MVELNCMALHMYWNRYRGQPNLVSDQKGFKQPSATPLRFHRVVTAGPSFMKPNAESSPHTHSGIHRSSQLTGYQVALFYIRHKTFYSALNILASPYRIASRTPAYDVPASPHRQSGSNKKAGAKIQSTRLTFSFHSPLDNSNLKSRIQVHRYGAKAACNCR